VNSTERHDGYQGRVNPIDSQPVLEPGPALRTLQIVLLSCAALLRAASAGAADEASAPPAEYDCMIEARQSIAVRSPVEGVIESILVQRGEVVKKGTLVATLSSGPERAALDLARSRATMEGELKSAEARVDLTRKKWERADELQKKNFVSANARDEAEAEYRLATEQLRAARENRRLAELDVNRAKEVLAQRSLKSPVNGVVVEVMLRPGELMSSNQKDPIMKIVEIDPLNVELVLPVSRFGRVKVGQLAEVLPEEPVGGSHRARVEVVDQMVDAASGTFGVRLRLANPGYRIPAGVKCKARF
jgi:RND family efflux transporter MFP subunit